MTSGTSIAQGEVAHPLGILDLGCGRSGRGRVCRAVLLLGQRNDAVVAGGTARVGRGLVGLLWCVEAAGLLGWRAPGARRSGVSARATKQRGSDKSAQRETDERIVDMTTSVLNSIRDDPDS